MKQARTCESVDSIRHNRLGIPARVGRRLSLGDAAKFPTCGKVLLEDGGSLSQSGAGRVSDAGALLQATSFGAEDAVVAVCVAQNEITVSFARSSGHKKLLVTT